MFVNALLLTRLKKVGSEYRNSLSGSLILGPEGHRLLLGPEKPVINLSFGDNA